MPKTYNNLFDEICSFQSLRRAFYKAAKSKFSRFAVINFSHHLEKNIFDVAESLQNESYQFGPYRSFYVKEPKLRLIESACFRDRVVHHSIHKALEPIFESQFYIHSYACRSGKGHHSAVFLLKSWLHQKPGAYFLKCDVKKFFPSIDRETLLEILARTITDKKLMTCLRRLVEDAPNKGIPIGNLTSQLFANIYLNELDQFVKRKLRVKHYIRYMDDFVLLADSHSEALLLRGHVENFLTEKLKLILSPQKVLVGQCRYGLSFLGFVVKPSELRLRGIFFRRMKRKLLIARKNEMLNLGHRFCQSPLRAVQMAYLGHVKFCDSHRFLANEILKIDLGFSDIQERRSMMSSPALG